MSFPDYLDKIFDRLEAMGVSLDTTYYELSLGAWDSVTGWPAKSYAGSTVKAAVIDKSNSTVLTGMGFYCKLDGVCITATEADEGDIFLSPQGVYYQVQGITRRTAGDKVVYYKYDLKHSYLVASIISPPGAPTGEYGFEYIVEGVSGFDVEFEHSTSPIV